MEILKGKIPQSIYERLEIAKIDTLDYFFFKSDQEICSATHISVTDLESLKTIVAEIILGDGFKTAAELQKDEKYWSVLHTGCSIIDKTVNGFPTKGITEVFGESGVGKTQLALQLALQVQQLEDCGGLDGDALYICTEDTFPSKRLQQLIDVRPKLTRNNQLINQSDNIFIEHIQDIDELNRCINLKLPVLLSTKKIKLIIIDSIAAVFRYDNQTSDYISRSEDLTAIAESFNNLSLQYHIVILCINQVTADPEYGTVPCLGQAWSNLVRKRIKLERSGTTIRMDNQDLPKRRLVVQFAPDTARNQCEFVVTQAGIVGLDVSAG
ncbi:spindle B [Carabus blaptoides fortunei]